ncbi:SH3 domain-containing protein [Zavarzinia sp. CC-PAN008]|uniref:SH3 domain-containing protein n=1 Tax=Zavarzinia sp. CC-PAN008 TaxID=3243332 RepID=UPI003F74552C
MAASLLPAVVVLSRAFVALAVACASLPALADTLPPRDDAARDPSLVSFRQSLRASISRKDIREVAAAAAPDIVLGFDGDQGRSVFKDFLTGDDDYWAELRRAAAQGGVFQDDGSFCQPYWTCVDLGDVDPFETVIVLKDKVVARDQPKDNAKVVGTFSYDILTANDLGESWVEVRLPAGGTGFLHTDDVGSPVGYRLSFEKRGGAWAIASFVAGD